MPQEADLDHSTATIGYPGQQLLEDAIDESKRISPEKYSEGVRILRKFARTQGIDKTLAAHDLDVILGPMDGRIPTIAAAAGYPVGTMPLGYSKTNGRPFGMCIVAAAGNEDKILRAMKAWDATVAKRKAPPQLTSKQVALRAALEEDGFLNSMLKAIHLIFSSLMQSMRKHAAVQLAPRLNRPHRGWESGLKLGGEVGPFSRLSAKLLARFKERYGRRKAEKVSTQEGSRYELCLGKNVSYDSKERSSLDISA